MSCEMSKSRFVWILLFAIILNFPFSLPAQEVEEMEEEEIVDQTIEEKQISLSTLLDMIRAEETVIFSNFKIVPTLEDNKFLVDKVFDVEYHLQATDQPERKVFFYDCVFDMHSALVFGNWMFKRLNFVNCTFNMPLVLTDCAITGTHDLLFENCFFHNDLVLNMSEITGANLRLSKNTFDKQFLLGKNLNQLHMDFCVFNADSGLFSKMDEEKTHYQLEAASLFIDEVTLNHCRFESQGISNLFSVDFGKTQMTRLTMFANQMSTINFTDAGIEKALLIDSLNISNFIGIQNFDFPEANTNVPWDNLKGQKLALFQTGLSELIVPYQAKTKNQLEQTLLYNDLISMYKKLNKLYSERGDLQSANGSYVEIKEIETSRQEYIQEVNPSTNNYINLLLNRVLLYFSDYATNPGKSVRRAWEILLLFTFIYMLSYSGWDGMNYGFYLTQFKLFATYIKEDLEVKQVYEEKEDPNANLMKEIKENYLRDRKKVPRAIILFGEPLHFLGRLRLVMVPSLIRFFDFQPKKWENLNASERILSGLIIFTIVVIFAVYVLAVKFINSFVLSLNSFIAIGFGVMPEKGLAMYISIIEGIIGWFLLTIFTITLFSQVLQGGA